VSRIIALHLVQTVIFNTKLGLL